MTTDTLRNKNKTFKSAIDKIKPKEKEQKAIHTEKKYQMHKCKINRKNVVLQKTSSAAQTEFEAEMCCCSKRENLNSRCRKRIVG